MKTRPRGYKSFFMLNSAVHEICPAYKSQVTNNCKVFLAEHSCMSRKISLQINMKMPTIVAWGMFSHQPVSTKVSIFISIREKFHAQLSWAWKKCYNLGSDVKEKCIYSKYLDRQAWANCVNPDQMPQNVASDQDLHCLPLIHHLLDTSTGSRMDFRGIFKDEYLVIILGYFFLFLHKNICCGTH